jgi:hypothetical protein
MTSLCQIAAVRAEALAVAPVVCMQNRYGLHFRGHDGVLRACAERSIASVPYFAIAGQSRQIGEKHAEPEQLLIVAGCHGAAAGGNPPPPQVAPGDPGVLQARAARHGRGPHHRLS